MLAQLPEFQQSLWQNSMGRRYKSSCVYYGHSKHVDAKTVFFFVVEFKGFKLNVISDKGDMVMRHLKHKVPQMDWDFVLKRDNGGALHMNVGFTYHP